ncbi:hypothetical protein GmHk_13G039331 [Glycine max]|nr:hypothetical protein GmHk_13G039331 [Glycine max]
MALCYKKSRTSIMQNMGQQDEGWPLGLLQPVNARIELVRNSENGGSISFNTLLTGSPSSSTDSSSDLDTESTGSFFPDQSITLGSLMGVSSIVELSRRSLRGTKAELLKTHGHAVWARVKLMKLKAKKNPPSIGQFLAVERRAANENRRNQSLPIYDPHDELALAETNNIAERNSLFMNGTIAPPHSISPRQSIGTERENRKVRQHNKGFGSLAELFSCMCGQDGFG